MYGDGPCVVLERAGPIDLAFLEGGHRLFVVKQQTYFVLGKFPVDPANGCYRPPELRTQKRGMWRG